MVTSLLCSGTLAAQGRHAGLEEIEARDALPAGPAADERPADAGAASPILLTGRVLGPDGVPVAGAVVVTSAGGSAASGSDGRFELALELPAAARSLEVGAIAAGAGSKLVASVTVDAPARRGTTPIGDLHLTSSTGCDASWVPTFGAAPGVQDTIWSLAVFDDGSGSGPALFAGGSFLEAGGTFAQRVAKWTGDTWSPLGSGVNSLVTSLAVFDDGSGSGPALYAGGNFTIAGGAPASHVARWDGNSWSPVGGGVGGNVSSLTTFDDGAGPALYAGGSFQSAGGASALRIAKWDGSTWSPLGSGLNGSVSSMTAFDDGSGAGPALHATGSFTIAGGVDVNRIAKWDGSAWSPLGTGLASGGAAMAVFDDGSGGGPALYVGGSFLTAGGVTVNRLAKWDGATWSPVGNGLSGLSYHVSSLAVFDDGGGPALHVGGYFFDVDGVQVNHVVKWDGGSWSPLGTGVFGITSPVRAMAVLGAGSGGAPALFVAGNFFSADGIPVLRIAKWNGTGWAPLGRGLDSTVEALAVFDDGSGAGPQLYAAGYFKSTGSVHANYIAKWDGSTWTSLGGGLNNYARALTVFDDGTGQGPALYAGGGFTSAGGVHTFYVSRWDGSEWSPMLYLNGPVTALAVFDDGSGAGPQLHAGGHFTIASGAVTANRVAKWDGSAWSPLGSGLNQAVWALEVFDDGSGARPGLYAAGAFTSYGANHIAKWDGGAWSPLGSGLSSTAFALASFDDGSGPALYAGGGFTLAGGVVAGRIARWDGDAWSTVGDGVNSLVRVLKVLDEGSGRGPALYAGGCFTGASGVAASHVARWDGERWSGLGSGVGGTVHSLAAVDSGPLGGSIFAGGNFAVSSGGDSYLARWEACPPALGVPFCAGDGTGAACPCGNLGADGAGCGNSAAAGALLSGAGSAQVVADDLVLDAAGLPPSSPVLAFAGLDAVAGGAGLAFGDGLRCVEGGIVRLGAQLAGPEGRASWGPGLVASGGWLPGDVRRFQAWYRDLAGPCGSGFNLSNGLELTFH